MYLLNHVKHKTTNEFCFNKSKHSALSAMCYLSQAKHCETSAMLFMKTQNQNNAECLTQQNTLVKWSSLDYKVIVIDQLCSTIQISYYSHL